MKFKNDGDNDVYVFGMHFASGATVDVSTKDLDKIAWLKSNFAEVKPKPKAEPKRSASLDDLPDLPTARPTQPEPTKKKTWKKKTARRRE